MTDTDETRPIRGEDAFDVGALADWLRTAGVDGATGRPDVTQFPGGASNLTYLLVFPDRELVLRRPPPGHKAKSAHDMGREYRIQTALHPVFPYVPHMVARCEDPAVIGSEFYVMDRVAGTILRADPPAGWRLSSRDASQLCRSLVDVLVELHAVDPRGAGLADLDRGPGYVHRQVDGWTRRYAAARTPGSPSFAVVTRWLAANRPDDVASCVVHNDYRMDNVVLSDDRPPRVLAVLDWEMATIGDPLMDLGGALAYWVQADDDPLRRRMRRQPTHLPGMWTRREIVDAYCERTGLSGVDWAFYEVFGLFRLAVILQQIYYRYHAKQTHNPAFRSFWVWVRYLDWRCRRLVRAAGE